MNKIKRSDGTVITEQRRILQEQYNFYKELCSQDKEICFELQNSHGPMVTETQRKMLNEDITAEELYNRI